MIMPHRSAGRLSLLLLALVFSNSATAAVPLILKTTNTTPPISIYNNVSYTPPNYKCKKIKFFRSDHRPTWAECYRAIRTLPSSHDRGTFHSFGLNNGYRLPMTEKFGRCTAQVELAEERVPAVSSWVLVNAALDQLSITCRRQVRQGDWTEDRTAGWMLMGPEDRIKVSLLGPDDGPFGIEGVGGGLFTNGTESE